MLRPMLGPCWARKIPNKKKLFVGNLCLGILGPLLGHFWGCQGLSWAMWKLLLATFGAINQLQPKNFRLELDFGPCWGLCWVILRLSGPILGHLVATFGGFWAMGAFVGYLGLFLRQFDANNSKQV